VKAASRPLKDAAYEQLARIGKATASPIRLEILDLLAQAPRTVEAIAEEIDQSIANASQHLQVLRRARMVERAKSGLFVTYDLAGDEVRSFVVSLRRAADARLAEVERITRDFFAARGALEPVDREALVKRIRRDEVTVLDVRPAEEYAAGHIRGARSIPIDELKKKLSSLPKSREIVAYCRGPYCVYSADAVKVLRAHGFKAIRFDEGVPDWKERGLPVEVGAPPRLA
jgi:rhodanese-related sulfurtransferase